MKPVDKVRVTLVARGLAAKLFGRECDATLEK